MTKALLIKLDEEDFALLDSMSAAEKISKREALRRCLRAVAPKAIQEAKQRRAAAAVAVGTGDDATKKGAA